MYNQVNFKVSTDLAMLLLKTHTRINEKKLYTVFVQKEFNFKGHFVH